MAQYICQLQKARDGGLMARLPSGKIAFPDRSRTIPAEAKVGQSWVIEITRETEKVCFFRLIENEDERKGREAAEQATTWKSKNFQEVVAALGPALQEFQDHPTLNKFADQVAGGPEKVGLGLTASVVERIVRIARQEVADREASQRIMDFLASWNEPEPAKPSWEFPDFQLDVECIENTWFTHSWEGDGMRGADDDGYRSAQVPANRFRHSLAEIPGSETWPIPPIIREFYQEEGEHFPLGTIKTILVRQVVENSHLITLKWDEEMQPWREWDWKRQVKALAKIVDGKASIPTTTSDGYPDIATLREDDPFFQKDGQFVPLGNWSDWEAWNRE